MKLAIMQPYFFPYVGYFDLINNVDKWIVYDTVQYIQHGWINRNRILHPNSGWQYITVPLNKKSFADSYRTAIKDIEISDNTDWISKIIRQLDHYRKKSPYYHETIDLIEECLNSESQFISTLDVMTLDKVCGRLNIRFDHEYFSEMDIELDPQLPAQQKVIRICQELGVTEYVNLSGGKELYDGEEFDRNDIKLVFRSIPDFEYACKGYEYIPKLSIIDLLMWNEPKKIKDFLDQQKEHN